ncbi:MAG TPA: carboxypeptidase regulatory-like domain-containing protein [Bryobacteraceae bacterium]|nr:carboxypeptidase regulatory-like domain-containing protein [Bryobacteraceae bacterium]
MGSLKMRFVYLVIISVFLGAVVWAQQTTTAIRGQVTDESGALVPGAKVTVSDSAGNVVTSVVSHSDGAYVVPNLPPGRYSVVAAAPGLKQAQAMLVQTTAGPATANLRLLVATETQTVTVTESQAPQVNTEPENNAGALVLKQEDLKALSDDPDDLQQDLQALAGPGAGPNGAQIYIDGFTGGQLPPKESIREIRINQNPFSSEYDRLGFGRIEILTKPGTDKFRGMLFLNISDQFANARNPFLTGPNAANAPFQTRQYGGNVSGPLSKKASFFLDFERRDINDASIITAITDPNNPTTLGTFAATPQERTRVSPRLDYQLTSNNTLTARYSFWDNSRTLTGIGGLTLPTAGNSSLDHDQDFQLTDSMVVSPKMINETRFRWEHELFQNTPLTNAPQIQVNGAFTGGGSGSGLASDLTNHYELQNYTSYVSGQHSMKFGVRLRTQVESFNSPANFNGTFTFNSLAQYALTEQLINEGVPSSQWLGLGGGPALFSINAGFPLVHVNQTDVGVFAQDDWRFRPNLTLSFGLRYETQTNIHDWSDAAPRFGFAWAPGGGGAHSRPKTVIRGGAGIFYDRFGEGSYLNAVRFNGFNEQTFQLENPDFFATTLAGLPPLSTLSGFQTSTARYQIARNLRAPYVIQSAIGIERQLPFSSTLSVNYTNTRGVHQFLTRDINAPLPGTFNPAVPGSGVRPYGNIGDIYQYESDGMSRQNQLMANINTRVSANLTMFVGYFYNRAYSDTNGIGSFVANPYNLREDWGRSAYDTRHRLFLVGSYQFRWAIRLSPFLMWNSGGPYNITVGRNLYGTGMFNARPALAEPGSPGAVSTSCGTFNANTVAGETMIPLNYCQGPSFFSLNVRLSKTFGFGGEKERAGGMMGGDHGHGGSLRPGAGAWHSIFSDVSTGRRYNLTIGIMARNLLNNVNYGNPIGVLTSPLFGQSIGIAGGYGPEGQYPVDNRRLEFQTRFTF